MTALRDAARLGRVVDFRERDRYVMAIHNALDDQQAALTTCTAEREAARQRVVILEAALNQVQRAEQVWNRTLALREHAEQAEAALVTLRAQLDRYLK